MSHHLSIGKVPSAYNPGEIARMMSRVEKAVNSLGVGLGSLEGSVSRVRREVVDRQKTEKKYLLTPVAAITWSEYDDGAGTIYAQAVFHFTQGWGRITTAQYRSASLTDGGNIDSAEAWVDLNDPGSLISFVADATYLGGGYYRLRIPMPIVKRGQKNTTFGVQVQALDADDAVWFMSSSTFDPDMDPEVDFLNLSVGNWNEGTTKWELFASGNADLDTGSVAFAVDSVADLAADSTLIDGDFNTGATNFATSDKRFVISLGTFDPSTASEVTVYVVAKAWTEINKGGTGQGVPYKRAQVRIPRDPFDSDLIDDGELTANMLETAAQRATIRLNGRHKSSFEHSTIQYNGYITYGDTTTYNMAGDGTTYQDLVPTTLDTLYYVFFDPGGWYGDGSGTPTTQLQITTSETIAKAITGRRLLVGHVRTASSPERAFYVLTGDQVVITAPFIYASKLSTLSANMGTLTSGEAIITNGANTIWLNPSGSLGVFAIGPTAGGYAAAPFRVAADGTTTVTALVATGYGQTQRQNAAPTTRANTTALQTGDIWIDSDDAERIYVYDGGWQESLTGIPAGHITAGLLTSANWSTTLGSQISLTDGTIKMGGSSAPTFYWSGTTLAIAGTVAITGTTDLQSTLSMTGAGVVSVGTMKFGVNVDGGGNNGIYINTYNHWYSTGNTFRAGGASHYMSWNGSTLSVVGDITATTGTIGGFTLGATTLTATNLLLDAGNQRIILGSGNDIVSLDATDATYRLAIGHATYASAPFTVTKTGAVTASNFTLKTTGGATAFDPSGIFQNASITDLNITGTLTLGASGIIQTSGYPVDGVYANKDKFEVSDGATKYTKLQSGVFTATEGTWSTVIGAASMIMIGAGSHTTTMTNGSLTSNSYFSVAPTGDLVVGTVSGTLKLQLASGVQLAMPIAHGTSGQTLVTNGSGTMTWASPVSGTVTSVSGAGTVSGLTLTGTVTTTGSLTLGGTLSVTDGDFSGQLSVAKGGTGLTSLSTLLNSNVTPSSLGLVIGTNVQAYDAALTYLATAGGPSAIDKVLVSSAANVWAYQDAVYIGSADLDGGVGGTQLGIYAPALSISGTVGAAYGYIYIKIGAVIKKITLYDL